MSRQATAGRFPARIARVMTPGYPPTFQVRPRLHESSAVLTDSPNADRPRRQRQHGCRQYLRHDKTYSLSMFGWLADLDCDHLRFASDMRNSRTYADAGMNCTTVRVKASQFAQHLQPQSKSCCQTPSLGSLASPVHPDKRVICKMKSDPWGFSFLL